jgi:hypothetical protein
MKKLYVQNGDVLFFEMEEIPKGARKLSKKEIGKEFIVERGEGVNTHVLYTDIGELCDIIDVYEVNGEMFVKVKPGQTVKIKHNEHKVQPIVRPVRKEIEREYSYPENEERKVID